MEFQWLVSSQGDPWISQRFEWGPRLYSTDDNKYSKTLAIELRTSVWRTQPETIYTEIVVAKTKVSPFNVSPSPDWSYVAHNCSPSCFAMHRGSWMPLWLLCLLGLIALLCKPGLITGNPRRFKIYVGNWLLLTNSHMETCHRHSEPCRLCLKGIFPSTAQKPLLVEGPQ